MTHPNILLIYTDQQRWDALGASGNPHIHTPNLDKLAADGTNFDHCFVQNPLCMPSRASFLTGQYPSTLGITEMGVPVPEDAVTWGTIFGRTHHTAYFGKLHFQPHANRDHRELHPTYGFDELCISDEPGVYEDAYRAWVRRHAPEQLAHLSVGLPPATVTWQQTMGINDGVQHPSPEPRDDFTGAIPFTGDERYTHSAFVAAQTTQFLTRQTGQQPFFCVASFYSPHAPWVVPQRFLDLYDRASLPLPTFSPAEESQRQQLGWIDDYLREAKHGYYAMVSEVDWYVGEIVRTLQKTGQYDNTVIVFTSDHGEWLGDGVRFGKGYPGDDAVTRVPLIVRLPTGERGLCYSEIVEAVDVLPTLLDACGLQSPPHLQGRSFFDVLIGRKHPPRTSALVEFAGWKSLRTPNHRYLIDAEGQEWLWDQSEGEISAEISDPALLRQHAHLLLQRLIAQESRLKRSWVY